MLVSSPLNRSKTRNIKLNNEFTKKNQNKKLFQPGTDLPGLPLSPTKSRSKTAEIASSPGNSDASSDCFNLEGFKDRCERFKDKLEVKIAREVDFIEENKCHTKNINKEGNRDDMKERNIERKNKQDHEYRIKKINWSNGDMEDDVSNVSVSKGRELGAKSLESGRTVRHVSPKYSNSDRNVSYEESHYKTKSDKAVTSEKSKYDKKLGPRKVNCDKLPSPERSKHDTKASSKVNKHDRRDSPEKSKYNRKFSPKLSKYDKRITPGKIKYDRNISPERSKPNTKVSPDSSKYDKKKSSTNFDRKRTPEMVKHSRCKMSEKNTYKEESKSTMSQPVEKGLKVMDLREKLRLKRQSKIASESESATDERLSKACKRKMSDDENFEDIKRKRHEYNKEINNVEEFKIAVVDTTVNDEELPPENSVSLMDPVSFTKGLNSSKPQTFNDLSQKEKESRNIICYAESDTFESKETVTNRVNKFVEKEKHTRAEIERYKKLMMGVPTGVESKERAKNDHERNNNFNSDKHNTRSLELSVSETQILTEDEIEIEKQSEEILNLNKSCVENSDDKTRDGLAGTENTSQLSDTSILYANIGEEILETSVKSDAESDSIDVEIFKLSANVTNNENSLSVGYENESVNQKTEDCNSENLRMADIVEISPEVKERHDSVNRNTKPDTAISLHVGEMISEKDQISVDENALIVEKLPMEEENVLTNAVPEINQTGSKNYLSENENQFSKVFKVCNSNTAETKEDKQEISDVEMKAHDSNVKTIISSPYDRAEDLYSSKGLLPENVDLHKERKHKKSKKQKRNSKNSTTSNDYTHSDVPGTFESIRGGTDGADALSDSEPSNKVADVENMKTSDTMENDIETFPNPLSGSENSSAYKRNDSLMKQSPSEKEPVFIFRGVISETVSSKTSNVIENDDVFQSAAKEKKAKRRSKSEFQTPKSIVQDSERVVDDKMKSNETLLQMMPDKVSEDRNTLPSKTSSSDFSDSVADTTVSPESEKSATDIYLSNSNSSSGSYILSEKTSSVSLNNLTDSPFSSCTSDDTGSSCVSSSSHGSDINTDSSENELSRSTSDYCDMKCENIPSASEPERVRNDSTEPANMETAPSKSSDIEQTVSKTSFLESDLQTTVQCVDMQVEEIPVNPIPKQKVWKRRRHFTDSSYPKSMFTNGKLSGKNVSGGSSTSLDRSGLLQCLLDEIVHILDKTQKEVKDKPRKQLKKLRSGVLNENITTNTVTSHFQTNIKSDTKQNSVKESINLQEPFVSELNVMEKNTVTEIDLFSSNKDCHNKKQLLDENADICPEERWFGSWTGLSVAPSSEIVLDNPEVNSETAKSNVEVLPKESKDKVPKVEGSANSSVTKVIETSVEAMDSEVSIANTTNMNPFIEVDERPIFLNTTKNTEEFQSSLNFVDNPKANTQDVNKDSDVSVDNDNFMRKSSSRNIRMTKRPSPSKRRLDTTVDTIITTSNKPQLPVASKSFTGNFLSPKKSPVTPTKSASADSFLSSKLSKNVPSIKKLLNSPSPSKALLNSLSPSKALDILKERDLALKSAKCSELHVDMENTNREEYQMKSSSFENSITKEAVRSRDHSGNEAELNASQIIKLIDECKKSKTASKSIEVKNAELNSANVTTTKLSDLQEKPKEESRMPFHCLTSVKKTNCLDDINSDSDNKGSGKLDHQNRLTGKTSITVQTPITGIESTCDNQGINCKISAADEHLENYTSENVNPNHHLRRSPRKKCQLLQTETSDTQNFELKSKATTDRKKKAETQSSKKLLKNEIEAPVNINPSDKLSKSNSLKESSKVIEANAVKANIISKAPSKDHFSESTAKTPRINYSQDVIQKTPTKKVSVSESTSAESLREPAKRLRSHSSRETVMYNQKTPSKTVFVSKSESEENIGESPAKNTRSATKLHAERDNTLKEKQSEEKENKATQRNTISKQNVVIEKGHNSCKKNLTFTKDKSTSRVKSSTKESKTFDEKLEAKKQMSASRPSGSKLGKNTVKDNKFVDDTRQNDTDLTQSGSKSGTVRTGLSLSSKEKDIKKSSKHQLSTNLTSSCQNEMDLKNTNSKSKLRNTKDDNELRKNAKMEASSLESHKRKNCVKPTLLESANRKMGLNKMKENEKALLTKNVADTDLTEPVLSSHSLKSNSDKPEKRQKKSSAKTDRALSSHSSKILLCAEFTGKSSTSFGHKLFEYESVLEDISRNKVSKKNVQKIDFRKNNEKKQTKSNACAPNKRKDTMTSTTKVTSKNPDTADKQKDKHSLIRSAHLHQTCQSGYKMKHRGDIAVSDETETKISYDYNDTDTVNEQEITSDLKYRTDQRTLNMQVPKKNKPDSKSKIQVASPDKAKKGMHTINKKLSETQKKHPKQTALELHISSTSSCDSDSSDDSTLDEKTASLVRSIFGSSDSSGTNKNKHTCTAEKTEGSCDADKVHKHVDKETGCSRFKHLSEKHILKESHVEELHSDLRRRSGDKHRSLINDFEIHTSKRKVGRCHEKICSDNLDELTKKSDSEALKGRIFNNVKNESDILVNASEPHSRRKKVEYYNEVIGTDNCDETTDTDNYSVREQVYNLESESFPARLKKDSSRKTSETINYTSSDVCQSFSTTKSTSETLLLDLEDTLDNTDYVDSLLHERSFMSDTSKSSHSFQETQSIPCSHAIDNLNESHEEGEISSSDDECSEELYHEPNKLITMKGTVMKESKQQNGFSPIKFPIESRNQKINSSESPRKKESIKSVRMSSINKMPHDTNDHGCIMGSEKHTRSNHVHDKQSKEQSRKDRIGIVSSRKKGISSSPNISREKIQQRTPKHGNLTPASTKQRRHSVSRSPEPRDRRRSRSHSPRNRHRHQSRSYSRSPHRHSRSPRRRSRSPRRHHHRSRSSVRRPRSPVHCRSGHKSGSRKYRSPSPSTPLRHRNASPHLYYGSKSNRRCKSRSQSCSPCSHRRFARKHEHSESHHRHSVCGKHCSHETRHYSVSEEDNHCSSSACKHRTKSDIKRSKQRSQHSPEYETRHSHRHGESYYRKRKRRSCSYTDSGRSRSRSKSKETKLKRQRANLGRHFDCTSDENDTEVDESQL